MYFLLKPTNTQLLTYMSFKKKKKWMFHFFLKGERSLVFVGFMLRLYHTLFFCLKKSFPLKYVIFIWSYIQLYWHCLIGIMIIFITNEVNNMYFMIWIEEQVNINFVRGG